MPLFHLPHLPTYDSTSIFHRCHFFLLSTLFMKDSNILPANERFGMTFFYSCIISKNGLFESLKALLCSNSQVRHRKHQCAKTAKKLICCQTSLTADLLRLSPTMVKIRYQGISKNISLTGFRSPGFSFCCCSGLKSALFP